ncbi:MAG: TlpA family protein disulfide reductase [Lachnospiraceae bacterium]|nr:TlpA family protein disulfide reductase [Lachnospiraceae bacterium]
MRKNKKRLCSFMMVVLCSLTLLNGCGSEKKNGVKEDTAKENIEENKKEVTDTAPETYKPAEFTIPSQDFYEYSYMGLNFSLPENLLERIERQEVAMLSEEEIAEDETTLNYALIKWKSMTEEQCVMEVESGENSFSNWADDLTPIGTIGAYQDNVIEKLDDLTECTEHKEIGRSKDGMFTYYLSVNSDVEDDLREEINKISFEFTDVIPFQDFLSSEGAGGKSTEGDDSTQNAQTENLGEFSMQDIEGETYTQEMFADYDLTMVNVFTTWCTPCINEIPDLEKLRNEMKDQGVNVVGIVLNGRDGFGKEDEETLEKAKLLAEKTGASYPFLIPDEGYLNGRLLEINAVPETFFADREGNIVGETYSGSRSLEEWQAILEIKLKEVQR